MIVKKHKVFLLKQSYVDFWPKYLFFCIPPFFTTYKGITLAIQKSSTAKKAKLPESDLKSPELIEMLFLHWCYFFCAVQ